MEASMFQNKNRIIKIALIVLLSAGALYKGARIMWGEHYLTFFKGILRHPLQVGAFSPCSTFVTREMTKYIAQEPSDKTLRILEVGAGSGVITTQIEKALEGRTGDYTVDVIEIDPEYCQLLSERFKHNPHFKIHCVDASAFTSDYQYDHIMCSLPFSTLPTEVVSKILAQYEKNIVPGGKIAYVEHLWLPAIKSYILRGDEKKIYEQKRAIVNDFKSAHIFETKHVYANITPLYVYHLQVTKQ